MRLLWLLLILLCTAAPVKTQRLPEVLFKAGKGNKADIKLSDLQWWWALARFLEITITYENEKSIPKTILLAFGRPGRTVHNCLNLYIGNVVWVVEIDTSYSLLRETKTLFHIPKGDFIFTMQAFIFDNAQFDCYAQYTPGITIRTWR